MLIIGVIIINKDTKGDIVGIYFRGLGIIFWIIGVVGSLAYYDTIQAFGNYAYILWMVVTVLMGLFFIAFGELMILLQKKIGRASWRERVYI